MAEQANTERGSNYGQIVYLMKVMGYIGCINDKNVLHKKYFEFFIFFIN